MTTTLKASLIRKAIRDYNYQYDAISGLKELLGDAPNAAN